MKLFYQFNEFPEIVPEEIKRPRRTKKLPNVLTPEEVESILRACRNIKHKALLCLVYRIGLGIGEALNLRINDLSRQEILIYIRQSKGMKDRRVPLSSQMLVLLEQYHRAYRLRIYVFEGR